MCRNIKQLRYHDRPASADECALAARQYVRKVSGFRQPSRANEAAYEAAVAEIAAITERLLSELTVAGKPAPHNDLSTG